MTDRAAMPAESPGTRRERQVRDTAARLGVADFVFTCPSLSKGTGSREVSGDGLLVVGSDGAVLQVKSRDPSKHDLDDASRVACWVRKESRRASRQGSGVKRELARRRHTSGAVVVTPARVIDLPNETRDRYARLLDVDPSTWPVLVVIDHPHADGIDLGFEPGVFWITFNDWRELHLRLRSTHGLVRYVHRVLDAQLHVPLGYEVDRYAALQHADAGAASGARTSVPTLPDPLHFDTLGADLLHDIIDKVWPDDGFVPWQQPDEYRAIVEFFDRTPATMQAVVGRWILEKRRELANHQHVTSGGIAIDYRDRLIYACDLFRNWSSEEDWLHEVSRLAAVRHIQALDTGAPLNSQTLGVGALVRDSTDNHGVAYTFTLIQGHVDIPVEARRYIEWTYGIHDHGRARPRQLVVGRNEPCPCASEKKYKHCHGRLA